MIRLTKFGEHELRCSSVRPAGTRLYSRQRPALCSSRKPTDQHVHSTTSVLSLHISHLSVMESRITTRVSVRFVARLTLRYCWSDMKLAAHCCRLKRYEVSPATVQIMQMAPGGASVEWKLFCVSSFAEANGATLVIKINNYPITCFLFSLHVFFSLLVTEFGRW